MSSKVRQSSCWWSLNNQSCYCCIYTPHTDTHMHTVFSSLSDALQVAIKPCEASIFVPTGRIHCLTFICTNLFCVALFWHWMCISASQAVLFESVCSAACLTNCSTFFIYKTKATMLQFHRVQSRPSGWPFVSRLTCFLSMSSHCFLYLSSLFLALYPHRCSFFLLWRYRD